jgi:predicted dehydrogenase
MRPVVWGVLSVSSHYTMRVHTNTRKSPLVELRGIASRSREKAARAARELGLAKAYGSYEELIADKEIEAVYIPLPNHLHSEWVKKAVDAGKHVLCEKPFALSAAEAEETFRYVGRKGVLVMEALMYPFHPQWQRAREIVQSGEIGEVHAVHVFFSYSIKDPKNVRNILEIGGGGIRDIGGYAVSCARLLIGAEPQRVVSLVKRDPGLRTDILSSGILDFGGPRAVFTVATQTAAWQRVNVAGSGGDLTVHIPFNPHSDAPSELTVTNWLGPRTVSLPAADQYTLMFEAFSRAVREGGPVPLPHTDAVNNQKVVDALFRSETSGTWDAVS